MLAEPLSPDLLKLRRDDGRAVEWVVSPGRIPYLEAVAEMETRAAAIAAPIVAGARAIMGMVGGRR